MAENTHNFPKTNPDLTLHLEPNPDNPHATDIHLQKETSFAELEQVLHGLIGNDEAREVAKRNLFETLVDEYGLLNKKKVTLATEPSKLAPDVTLINTETIEFGDNPKFSALETIFRERYPDKEKYSEKINKLIALAFNQRNSDVSIINGACVPDVLQVPNDLGIHLSQADFDAGLQEILESGPDQPKA